MIIGNGLAWWGGGGCSNHLSRQAHGQVSDRLDKETKDKDLSGSGKSATPPANQAQDICA